MPLGFYMAEQDRGYRCTTRLFKSFRVALALVATASHRLPVSA
jgi:hypothetical protein